jgi:hypothetical protein
MAKMDLSDYVTVAERLVAFRKKYPDGRMSSEVVETGFEDYIAVKAYCYRDKDDSSPGVGLAWEPVPGPTPFTKNSELQNAETSAWGRALVAALVSDTSRGIASQDEIREPEATVVKEVVEENPAEWLKNSVQVFGLWTPEQSRDAYTVAMNDLEFERLSSMKRADKVFGHMSDAYYTDNPAAAPF